MRLLSLLTVLVLGLAAPIEAQQVRVERIATGYRVIYPPRASGAQVSSTLPNAETMLRAFAAERTTPGGPNGIGESSIAKVIVRHQLFPRATVDSVVTGLTRLAIHHHNGDVRAAAIQILGGAASADDGQPVPGMTARLLRLYSDVPAQSKVFVLDGLARAADHRPAVGLMRRIAAQTREGEDFPGAAAEAVFRLGVMGSPGAAALRELHERNMIRDPEARRKARVLSQNGFRVKRTER